MNEETSLISNTNNRKQDKIKLYLSYALLGLILACFIAALAAILSSKSSIDNKIDDTFATLVSSPSPAPTYTLLPHTRHVADTSITPVKNQQSRGTCWVFSSIGIIEASYRENGLKKGFLKENEYVAFSEQAHGLEIIDHCQNHPEDLDLCYGTGPWKNTTEDGVPEWVYYFGNDIDVFPEAICEYQPTTAGEFICPQRNDKTRSTNPLRFKPVSIESATAVTEIKNLLNKYTVPLTWVSIVAEQTYRISCDENEAFAESEVCKQCLYPKDPLDKSAGCYALYILPSYDNEGIFSMHGTPFVAGGHAMMIVGYNDNFRVDVGGFGDLDKRTLGGFIVKNSWGPQIGHSIKYWAQEISPMDEAMLCPDETAATKWLPACHKCMLQKQYTVKQCSSDQYKRVRDQYLEGATILKCSGASKDAATFYGFGNCNPEKKYVLAKIPDFNVTVAGTPSGIWTVPTRDNFFKAHLVEFTTDADGIVTDASLIHTGETTWLGLSKIFTPETIIGNDPNVCGYVFLPYQYYQIGTTSVYTGHDTPGISAITLEWDDSSYLVNKDKYPQYNYTLLELSTKKADVYHFDGPFDFNYNKKK